MERAFVAVVPAPHVHVALDELRRDLRADIDHACAASSTRVRWTTSEQWHVTIAFLGDDVDLDAAARTLDDLVLDDHAPFDVGLCGVGVFPRPRAAQVLWCGVGPGRAQLESLVRVTTAGFGVPETRRIIPHLTIARLRPPTDLAAVVGSRWRAPSWRAHELVLVESRRDTAGSAYRVHHRRSLGRGTDNA